MGNTLLNLLRAGYGYAGQKTGMLSPSQAPDIVQEPAGGSAWWAKRMRERGLLKDNPGSRGDIIGQLAGMLAPAVAQAKAPQIAAGVLRAQENAAIPRTLNPQTGAIVYHGSPHKFDKFDSSKIGTGEGAQAYGHGLYLADAPDVAMTYQPRDPRLEQKIMRRYSAAERAQQYPAMQVFEDFLLHKTPQEVADNIAQAGYSVADKRLAESALKLATKEYHAQRAGSLYKVDLPDEAIARMLDWDKPLSQQAPNVKSVLERLQQSTQVFTTRPAPAKGMIEIVAPSGDGMGYYKPSEVDEAIQNMTAGFMRNAGSRELKAGDVYERLQRALARLESDQLGGPVLDQASGRDFYKTVGKSPTGQVSASEALRKAGIPGIRYLDGNSRGTGAGTSNYVVFPGEESLLKILSRNDQPIP
jgi:hypothetical protein